MDETCFKPKEVRRETVSGFARYSDGIDAINPPVERTKLDTVARAIAASRNASCAPVQEVIIVGHADRDPTRGTAYERQISLQRAERVKSYLTTKVGAPTAAMIQWRTEGAGATAPVVPAPQTEEQRRPNRRVEIVCAAGQPQPVPQPIDPTGAHWRRVLGTGVTAGNAVTALVDGAETFRAYFDAIRTARGRGHYVYLLGWWLDDDVPLIPGNPASTINSLFADLSAKGVQVRAMLWDQVGRKNTREVARINARPGAAAILDNETLRYGSHHQKVLVVKGDQGLIAFCGGIDINWDRIIPKSASSSSGTAGAPMHDVHCRIVGPSAFDLLLTFLGRWRVHPRSAAIDARAGTPLGAREPRPSPGGTRFVRVARTTNVTNPTVCSAERGVRDVLMRAIGAAQRFIYVEDQYLVAMEVARALHAALPRIQHLTILIPDSPLSDLPQVWRRRKEFIDLLRSSPHRAKVHIAVLAPPGAAHTYVHAKTWIVDDEVAIIGSPNLNRRGLSHDSEVLAAIFDRRAAMPGSVLPPNFAQALRMRLWSEHLRVPAATLRDGVATAGLWRRPPPTARIRAYNPTAGTDPIHQRPDFVFDTFADPSGDRIPICRTVSIPSRLATGAGVPSAPVRVASRELVLR